MICRIVDGFYFKSRKNFKTFFNLSLSFRLVEQVLSRLQPGLSEARLASALENLGR